MRADSPGVGSCLSRSPAAIWGILMQCNGLFAVVFAAVVAPNGQEWYQARFGTEGRLGRMLDVLVDRRPAGDAHLDLRLHEQGHHRLGQHAATRSSSAWDTSRTISRSRPPSSWSRHNEIKGNILNTSMHQGDVLVWKAAPKRKTYVDGRSASVPARASGAVERHAQGPQRGRRRGLEAAAGSVPITAVMIETQSAPHHLSAADAEPATGSHSTTTAGS